MVAHKIITIEFERERNRRQRAIECGRQRAVSRRDLARFDPRLPARSCGKKRDRDPRPKTRVWISRARWLRALPSVTLPSWRVGACRSRRAHCTSRISPAAQEQSQSSRQPEDADAAETMAKADSSGRTTRRMIVTANPFLEKFTVADLKEWAEARMAAAGASR